VLDSSVEGRAEDLVAVAEENLERAVGTVKKSTASVPAR
jgi:hypothetical protein